MSRRLPVLLSLIALVPGVAACGGEHEEVVNAETEGQYFHVGGVEYQVQLSRQLNPADPEDRDYLKGVLPAEAELEEGQTWFGVFLRAENETDGPVRTADEFAIEDTTGEEFEPVPVDNPLAWESTTLLEKDDRQPNGIDAASYTPTGAPFLLFKIPEQSLDNRPLELIVRSSQAPDETGSVALDV